MSIVNGVDTNSSDQLQVLEDSIAWCIEHRAYIRFYHNGSVLIRYDDVRLQSGESLLDAIALASGEKIYEPDEDEIL